VVSQATLLGPPIRRPEFSLRRAEKHSFKRFRPAAARRVQRAERKRRHVLLDLERACARGGLVAAARADQRLVAAGPHQAGAGADAGASYGPSALTRIARTLPAA